MGGVAVCIGASCGGEGHDASHAGDGCVDGALSLFSKAKPQ